MTDDPSADSKFSADLRELLVLTATTGAMASTTTHHAALEHIVETAAGVLHAQAASLFLVDEEREELVFQVALGAKADATKQFRVPLGHGIAGYVATTGQAIAVTDAQRDPRFASDIGQAIGYLPRTILCVPLYLRDRVIGVLELLDKADGQHFSTGDMEILGRFANLAALTLDQSRLTHDLRHLFRSLLGEIVQGQPLEQAARAFADRAADHAERSEALRMAGLIHEIWQRGADGRRLAGEILTSVARFVTLEAGRAG